MRSFKIIQLILLMLLTGISVAKSEGPIFNEAEYYLSEVDLANTRKQALSGNAAAANRLYEFYSMFQGDNDGGIFWMRLAAELGDCAAIVSMDDWYASKLKKNTIQSAYWLEKKSSLHCKEK